MKKRNYYLYGIVIGLVLAIIGYAVSNMVKTDFGKVAITEVGFISPSGFFQSLNVSIPKNVTAKNPGPAIIVTHGGNGERLGVKLYCTELARRGYVVLAGDMLGHGKSQKLPDSQWTTAGRGVFNLVKYARTLPYVDVNRIGLLGWSRGGMATQETLLEDNKEGTNYIKNAYLIFADPIVRNKAGFTDIYGARNVGLIADLYDEFFFAEKPAAINTGVYSNDANKVAQVLSNSVGFATSPTAQAFLHFGDPTGKEKRTAGIVYEKVFGNGAVGTRSLTTYFGTHREPTYSAFVLEQAVSFFHKYMPSGATIANNDFIYKVDQIFSLIGMIGLLVFMVSFTLYLVFNINGVKDVYVSEPELKETGGAKGIFWLWGLMLIITVFGVYAIKLLNTYLPSYKDALFPSSQPIYGSILSILTTTAALVACLVWYAVVGKRNNFDLKSTGIYIDKRRFLKTALIAIVAVLSMYLVVFGANYATGGQFYFWYWFLLPFDADRTWGMLTTWPILLVAHTTLSICANCFIYSKALTSRKWLNHILFGLLAALPAALVIVYVFGYFMATGWNPMFGGLGSAASQLTAFPAVIFCAVIVSRILYSQTGNPYLGGIVNGTLTTIFMWTICEIRLPEPGKTFPMQALPYIMIVSCFIIVAACMVYFYKSKPAAVDQAFTIKSGR